MNTFLVKLQQWLDGKAIHLPTTEAFGAIAMLIAIVLIRGCA